MKYGISRKFKIDYSTEDCIEVPVPFDYEIGDYIFHNGKAARIISIDDEENLTVEIKKGFLDYEKVNAKLSNIKPIPISPLILDGVNGCSPIEESRKYENGLGKHYYELHQHGTYGEYATIKKFNDLSHGGWLLSCHGMTHLESLCIVFYMHELQRIFNEAECELLYFWTCGNKNLLNLIEK